MTTLEEIAKQIKLFHTHPNLELSYIDEAKLILKTVEKRIDKVEQDYKNELNDWGKSQPIEEMWPKEMKTLERVRKELLGIEKKK